MSDLRDRLAKYYKNMDVGLKVIPTTWPKVPTRFIYTGDTVKGRNYQGLGRKRFFDLMTSLGYHPSPANEVGFNTLKLDDGVEIKTSMSYGVSKINIHVPIVKYVEVVEEAEEKNPVYFYYRIKNEGLTYSELLIDRIIIWEMGFTGLGFTPEANDINYANNFTPGDGTVILDVDIENEVVYVPSGATATEKIIHLATATTYISKIASEELPDISTSMFISGEVSDPMKAYRTCTSEYFEEVSLYMNETYNSVAGYNYWHMMDHVPIGSVTTWRAKYCPAYGGTPDIDYLANIWPGLDDNASFYGELIYPRFLLDPNDTSDPRAWEYHYVGASWYSTPWSSWVGLFVEVLAGYYGLDSGMLGGMYFTGSDSDNQFDSFFCFYQNYHNNGGNWISYQEQEYTSPDTYLGITTGWGRYDFRLDTDGESIVTGASTKFISPLENLTLTDVVDTYNSPDYCQASTCFDLAIEFHILTVATEETRVGNYTPFMPCDLKIYGGIYDDTYAYSFHKSGETYDSDIDTFLYVPDSTKITSRQKHFVGLLSYFESSVMSQTAHVNNSGEQYRCGDTGYGYVWATGVPKAYVSGVGIVLYIFAPEYFINDTTYWNIHTARYSSSQINPYRCLDFEEYIMDIIVALKDGHRIGSVVAKYDSEADGIYTLDYYDYIQTHGFINEQ